MNRLADSLSPYLLQHQHNPVDWFPWCEDAFDSAVERDVPVFLSVGYAACHWCHVMERESFESESIAAILNEHFVSIKVDREERPDIDQIYMNAVQAMTGQGGWPMSVFLNHQRQPFYAGTYFPPQQRFGMPGFAQLLSAIVDAWQNRRPQVDQQAGEITDALQQLAGGGTASSVPGDDVIASATDTLLRVLDRADGGFGSAPKFPHATDLDLLLRRGVVRSERDLIDAAELTLDKMAAGGIRDHIGGGFARYSVDAKWLVPHFEKMLYDNALLADVYLRAFQVTGNVRHADIARETLRYLCRDMFDSSGGIHCSEDADSEGVEGKFYVWTPEEVSAVLGAERGERFCKIYDITPGGNFEGNSIPNLPKPISWWASKLSLDLDALTKSLADDRQAMWEAREQRVKPGRDDKVLTSWNAMAIKALALGGAVLDEDGLIQAAERVADFITSNMLGEDGRLLHAFRGGQAHVDGYVDDYAYTVEAFIALYEATGKARWIGRAVRLADRLCELFEDKDAGGFFYTAADADTLITRNKEWHDGSLISGNASAAMGLLKLSQLCHRDDFLVTAEQTFRAGAEVISKQSPACGGLISALDRYRGGGAQLVLAVPNMECVKQLRSVYLSRFRPHAVLSWVIGDAPESGPVVALNEGKRVDRGVPTLYRCENFTCEQPICGDQAVAWLEAKDH